MTGLAPDVRASECEGGRGSSVLADVDALVRDMATDVAALWARAVDDEPDAILETDLPAWMERLMRGSGKRIRPLMCEAGFVAAGEAHDGYEAMVRAAAGLELLHLFALVHDDVMDESDTRRGTLSAHRVATEAHMRAGGTGGPERYGESIAVLLGDLTHAVADAVVAPLPAPMRRLWFELNVELIAGQREDITGAATPSGGRRRARRIARIKSGAYTVTRPLQLGALAAGAGPDVLEVLERYGDEVGIVFAARDDLLGVWGDPKSTGKPAGDDLRQRKPTTLRVDAERHLPAADRVLLDRVGTCDERPGDLEALQDAMLRAGVRERAERTISDGVDRAVTILRRNSHLLTRAGIASLDHMTRKIAWRNS